MSTLSDAERDQVARIKKDEYVPVDVQSFYKIAVLSGQITESEFKYFTENAIEILSASEKLYEAGLSENSQVRINIKGGGGVFIYRTVSEAVFNRAQKEVLKIFKNIKGSYSGNPITDDLYGIKITIRGTSRFFDISGIPGLNDRAWIGFDLRRPDQH